jgi:predicted esterase
VPKQIFETRIAERRVRDGTRISLRFRVGDESIPAILQLPLWDQQAPTVPAALLLHGYASEKALLADTAGKALLAKGVASLAIDLPLHGERTSGLQSFSRQNPLAMLDLWKLALDECATALHYLAAHKEIDARRLGLMGYSMGAYLGVIAASQHRQVRAIVLAAGGDLPDNTVFGNLVRMAADPTIAVRQLDGRPLLMVNGRFDRTVTADQAERLYAAASQPKELRWFQTGHRLPPNAVEFAAQWLSDKLSA